MTSTVKQTINPDMSMGIKNESSEKKYDKPPVRIELTTPGLQDQCSNH